jgi:hypothetical protein
MDSFFKALSVFKIFLIEILAVFFFPPSVTGLINEIRPATLAAYHNLDGFEAWLFFPVGPLLLAWILKDIFRPKLKHEGWKWLGLNISFDFCSTHPSYILIDLFAIAFAAFYFWIGKTGDFEMPVYWIMLGTAGFIPLARLFSWFILGLKIGDYEAEVAHLPVIWAGVILSIAFGPLAAVMILN